MSAAATEAEGLMARGEFEAAEAAWLDAIRAETNCLPHRVQLAATLAKQLVFERAIELCLHVLHTPDLPRHDLAHCLEILTRCAPQVGSPETARPYLDKIDTQSSPYPSDRCWRFVKLRQLGYLDEARRGFAEVLARFPDNPFAANHLGDAMLEQGDPAGWPLSLRFTSRDFYRLYYAGTVMLERLWQGEPLEGKSIVVIPHCGFGDCFQHIAHLVQLRRLGVRRITFMARGNYSKLLESADVDEVVGVEGVQAAREASDYWVGEFGLAQAELMGGGEKPKSSYLTPPASPLMAELAQRIRIAADGRLCIGLYWHSDAQDGDAKSVPLSQIVPLLQRPDVHWVILQHGYGLRRFTAAGLAGRHVTILEGVPAFDDASVLMRALDGVATICAWPFHLAGAIGQRTWLLAGRVLSPRHLNSERASYLYSDVARIARQPRIGDWAGAIRRLNEELDAVSAQRRAEGRGGG